MFEDTSQFQGKAALLQVVSGLFSGMIPLSFHGKNLLPFWLLRKNGFCSILFSHNFPGLGGFFVFLLRKIFLASGLSLDLQEV
jgi:hypothetical protein